MNNPIKSILLAGCVFQFLQISAQTYTMPLGNPVTTSATTCSGTLYDDGGVGGSCAGAAAGNYANAQNSSYVFYPAVAGQYTSITFNTFCTEAAFDYVNVYDGPGGPLIATYSGSPVTPFTVTASASNPTRALCVRFHSNASTTRTGYDATIACSAVAGAAPVFTPSVQDCQQGGGITICSNTTFSGNSSGIGAVQDVAAPWRGCLTMEHQSSWYYFSPLTAGTVGFTISPQNGTDDYDFAIWGPFSVLSCPSNLSVTPLRCSYAAGGGNTGCGNGAVDVSENSLGDKWVSTFNVLAGEIYVMVIDNFSATLSPFDLSWNLTAGASLGCSVLPIELISFDGSILQTGNYLGWETATETNNAFFTVERAGSDGVFSPVGRVNGSGSTTTHHSYSLVDPQMNDGTYYYRIRQTDFNGFSTLSGIVALSRHNSEMLISDLHPNPTNGEVQFNFNSTEETTLHVVITDLSGRTVVDELIQANEGKTAIKTSIDISGGGIYMLHVTDENSGMTSVSRIIKY